MQKAFIQKKSVKIGEILLSQKAITPDQLDHAIIEQKKSGIPLGTMLVKLGYVKEDVLTSVLGSQLEVTKKKRLGEMLVDQGYITIEQLETALREQKHLGMKLGKVLVQMGFLDEEKLLNVLAAQLDFQHVVLDSYNFDPDIIKLISEEMARSYKTIPLYTKGSYLTVAIADPTNLRFLDHIKFKTGYDVEPVIATEHSIVSSIDRAYMGSGERLAQLLGSGGDDDMEVIEVQEEEEGSLADEEGKQVIKIVNLLVTEAIREGASDIHLEPMENYLRLRYRVDGILMEKNPIPKAISLQVISRLKILSGMDIAEKRKPLDGRFSIRHQGKEVDLRVSTFPATLRGRGTLEKVVIRILNFDVSKVDLKKLGFSKQVYQSFTDQIKRPNGILLVTGPTGSGKSSTLYACIKHVSSPEVNIITMEDPVEMNLPGITQGQINNKAGFGFAEGMRSILRQDPDIIMLGEMRDTETASMAIQAALTGHMVFSTLHTNDASEAFTRLLDMGIEPFLIIASLRGILAQRLVRSICEKCKVQVQPSDDILKSIGIRPGTAFYKGSGCKFCNGTGYRGRMGIFEFLVPDEKINAMVYKGESSDVIKDYAIKQLKMSTLRRDGLEKALAGFTTLEQVLGAS